MDKVPIKFYAHESTRAAVQEVAAGQGLSASAWIQITVMEAIDEYRQKQARKAANAEYDGRALL